MLSSTNYVYMYIMYLDYLQVNPQYVHIAFVTTIYHTTGILNNKFTTIHQHVGYVKYSFTA